MNNKSHKEIQIYQLERDIRIIQDILDEKIENYTKQPIPVLRDSLFSYQDKLNQLRQDENC